MKKKKFVCGLKINAIKDARMDLRLSVLEKKVIEETAKLQGYSVSDLILRDTFIKSKKYLQDRGYKISQKVETLRGIDLFLKPDKIRYSSIRSVDQLKMITAPIVQNSKNSCLLCGHVAESTEALDEPGSPADNN